MSWNYGGEASKLSLSIFFPPSSTSNESIIVQWYKDHIYILKLRSLKTWIKLINWSMLWDIANWYFLLRSYILGTIRTSLLYPASSPLFHEADQTWGEGGVCRMERIESRPRYRNFGGEKSRRGRLSVQGEGGRLSTRIYEGIETSGKLGGWESFWSSLR